MFAGKTNQFADIRFGSGERDSLWHLTVDRCIRGIERPHRRGLRPTAPLVDQQTVDQRKDGLRETRQSLLGQHDRLERRAQDSQHDGDADDEEEDLEDDHGLRRVRP